MFNYLSHSLSLSLSLYLSLYLSLCIYIYIYIYIKFYFYVYIYMYMYLKTKRTVSRVVVVGVFLSRVFFRFRRTRSYVTLEGMSIDCHSAPRHTSTKACGSPTL